MGDGLGGQKTRNWAGGGKERNGYIGLGRAVIEGRKGMSLLSMSIWGSKTGWRGTD